MPPKPEVTITLSCCPRCGWPKDEEAEPLETTTARPATVPKGKTAAPAPKPERALDPDAFRRAVQNGWGPRSFGVSQEKWREHWTKDMLEKWYWRYMCQREKHDHDEQGVLECMEEAFALAKQAKRKPGRPKDPLKETFARWQEVLCYPDQHTHGDEGLLDCMMLQMLMRDIQLPAEITSQAAQAPLANAVWAQATAFDAAGQPMNSAVSERARSEGGSNPGTRRRSGARRAG